MYIIKVVGSIVVVVVVGSSNSSCSSVDDDGGGGGVHRSRRLDIDGMAHVRRRRRQVGSITLQPPPSIVYYASRTTRGFVLRRACRAAAAPRDGLQAWVCGRAASGWDTVVAPEQRRVVGKRLPSDSATVAAFQYVTDARASRHDRDARDSAVAAAAAATTAATAGTDRRDGQCEWRFSVYFRTHPIGFTDD